MEREYRKKSILQSHLLLMCPGPSAEDDDRYVATLLCMILGDSVGSRLYWSLIDSGIADSAGCDHDDKEGVGCVYAYASTTTTEFDRVGKILEQEMKSPAPFEQLELERAKNKLLSRIVLDGESAMGRMMSLGTEWQYRQRLHVLEEEIDQIKKIQLSDVNAVYQKYMADGWSRFTLIPGE